MVSCKKGNIRISLCTLESYKHVLSYSLFLQFFKGFLWTVASTTSTVAFWNSCNPRYYAVYVHEHFEIFSTHEWNVFSGWMWYQTWKDFWLVVNFIVAILGTAPSFFFFHGGHKAINDTVEQMLTNDFHLININTELWPITISY